MGITFQQQKNITNSSASSLAPTFGSATQANGFILVFTANFGSAPAVSSITDSASNTYNLNAVTINNAAGTAKLAAHYAMNTSSNASNTVTVTWAASGDVSATIWEYTGVALTSALDQTNSANGTSSTPSVGALTATNANSLYAAFLAIDGSGPITATGGSWTDHSNVGSDPNYNTDAEAIDSGSGSQSPSWSMSASQGWGALFLTFTPPVSGKTPWTWVPTLGPILAQKREQYDSKRNFSFGYTLGRLERRKRRDRPADGE